MFRQIERGRATVVTIIWLQLMLAVGVMLLCVAFLQFEAAGKRLLTFLCEIGLMISLYRGNRWGQWLYVFGFVAGAGLAALLWSGAGRAVPPLLAVALVGYFAWAAWAVGFSPSVRAFLRFQRGELDLNELGIATEDPPRETGDPTASSRPRACGHCGEAVPDNFAWCPLCGATCALDHA